MSDERFLHKRLGHSAKVSALTDFEFRVWTQYELSADDYGVMLFTPAVLQADNNALATRPAKLLGKALEHLVTVGLLGTFEHQRTVYAYQRDWHDFQKMRHQRIPIHPCPSAAVVEACTPATAEMFRKHPAYRAELFPKDSVINSEMFRPLARAAGREVANSQQLTANSSGENRSASTHRARFDRFWSAYPRKVAKDAAWHEWLRLRPVPDDAFTDRLIAAVITQQQSAQWQRDGGQYIPHPRTWLHQGRWQDEPDQAGVRNAFAGSHTPADVDKYADIGLRDDDVE